MMVLGKHYEQLTKVASLSSAFDPGLKRTKSLNKIWTMQLNPRIFVNANNIWLEI
jgi:hypothetical protein